MPTLTKYPEPLVFGLDIGTRSIVGTVGYREGKQFNIVAQAVRYHDTRAMLDGQIHDIIKVGEEIVEVKEALEEQLPGRKLKDVCIAAAGRVLKTAEGKGYYEFPDVTVVNQEYIHSLELMGIEEAHEKMLEENTSDDKFFCVGYSVIKYYLNGYEIGNLEGHKAHNISCHVLATFLPEEVVDGLYAAVETAGLEVANMTLEPIAAIQLAIPENYRLLNIAMIDVGAGTSDISITKDGSIVGYGMLPKAGDELTETLIKEYLVDFDTAEEMKMMGLSKKSLAYKDILSVPRKITPDEVYGKLDPVLEEITEQTAKRIIELNGGKPVAAAFVVGGGGKVPGYTDKLAKHLGIAPERVGLRGEEVLGSINILVEDVKKDPLLVTPIGICLNFFEQKNRFIYMTVNDERVKLYDNDKLTVFDAVVAYGLSNDDIFPKRGKDLNYTVNGKKRFIRGQSGEPAELTLNDIEVGMNHEVAAGDKINIQISTVGEDAHAILEDVVDLNTSIKFFVNEMEIVCPRYASVNGKLESGSYEINDGDQIEILNYFTLAQLMQYMDIETPHEVFVNGARAGADTKIYENFNVAWIDREDIYKAERFVTEEEYDSEELESEDVDSEESESKECESKEVESEESESSNIDSKETEPERLLSQESKLGSLESKESESKEKESEKNESNNIESEKADKFEVKDTDKKDIDANDTASKDRESKDTASKDTDTRDDEAESLRAVSGFSIFNDGDQMSFGLSDENDNGEENKKSKKKKKKKNYSIHITVNGTPITLSGKTEYVFIDIFDKYEFDLKTVGGTRLVQRIDGVNAGHFEPIHEGAAIDLYWEK